MIIYSLRTTRKWMLTKIVFNKYATHLSHVCYLDKQLDLLAH